MLLQEIFILFLVASILISTWLLFDDYLGSLFLLWLHSPRIEILENLLIEEDSSRGISSVG